MNLRKLIFFTIFIILLFYVLELFSRILLNVVNLPHGHIDPGIAGKDVLEFPGGYLKDYQLFWRLTPSFEDYNSLGFRDKEFSIKKDSGVFRIICLGDSITFGYPTKITDTYPKKVAKLLQKRYPNKRIESINAGVPGYTSYQGLIWSKQFFRKYKPDLLIIYYGVNDSGYNSNNKPDKDQKKISKFIIGMANFFNRFKTYKFFTKLIFYFKYPRAKKFNLPIHRVPPEDYKRNLITLKKLAEESDSKTVFITNPAIYDPKKKIVLTLEDYDPPANIIKFNIFELFKEREVEADKLFLDDTRPLNFHLTTKGQELLAKKIVEFLISKNICEFE